MLNRRRILLRANKGTSAPVAPWYRPSGIASANVLGAYLAKGAASLAVSHINISKPGTFDLATTTDPGWDATSGWKGNAAGSAYLDTGISPAVGLSIAIRASNVYYTTNNSLIGYNSSTGPTQEGVICLTTGMRYGQSGLYLDTTKPTSGVFIVTNQKAYYNGTYLGDITTVGSKFALSLYILARTIDGSAADLYSNAYVQAVTIHNVSWTQAQVTAIATAMAAL